MITALTEGNRRKADQYWPDEDNSTLELENNIKVTFASEETDIGLDRRSFLVSNRSILSYI